MDEDYFIFYFRRIIAVVGFYLYVKYSKNFFVYFVDVIYFVYFFKELFVFWEEGLFKMFGFIVVLFLSERRLFF